MASLSYSDALHSEPGRLNVPGKRRQPVALGISVEPKAASPKFNMVFVATGYTTTKRRGTRACRLAEIMGH